MPTSDVVIDLNVLGVFMEDIVMSNVDSTTIITIKRSGSWLWSIHVRQEPSKLDELADGVNKRWILSLNTGMGSHALLLAMPWDKRSTQQETKTCDGASICWITCPICILISMELERRLRGVVKTMIKCSLDILENPKDSSIMDRMRVVNKLTNHIHGMSNIWASDSEIDQTTN